GVVGDADKRDTGGERSGLVLVVVANADEDVILTGESGHDLRFVLPRRLPRRAKVEVAPTGQAMIGEELLGAGARALGPGSDVMNRDGAVEGGERFHGEEDRAVERGA